MSARLTCNEQIGVLLTPGFSLAENSEYEDGRKDNVDEKKDQNEYDDVETHKETKKLCWPDNLVKRRDE